MKKKILLIVCACALVVALSIAGTMAWLTDKTAAVENTFTVGNIHITLAETKTNFKMVPGTNIDKDPKVTVVAGSEACWLFVKVEKSATLDTYIAYTVDSTWTQGDGTNIPANVYYRAQDAIAKDGTAAVYSVISGDKVNVKNTVTKTDMENLGVAGATQPKLTFTAYAIQKEGFGTAAAAWAEASK